MSEAVLGPKSAKYLVFCGYTWKTPVYLENTWVSCRFPQFCPRFCPRPALRLRETREFPEGNSRETEWSTKHPLVSLETSGNAKCWGPLVSLWVAGNPRKGQVNPAWAQPGLPLAPRLFSFPFFSTAPSLFLLIFPGKPSNFPGSEPRPESEARLGPAQNQPNLRNTGYFAGIPGNPRYT